MVAVCLYDGCCLRLKHRGYDGDKNSHVHRYCLFSENVPRIIEIHGDDIGMLSFPSKTSTHLSLCFAYLRVLTGPTLFTSIDYHKGKSTNCFGQFSRYILVAAKGRLLSLRFLLSNSQNKAGN